MSLLDLVQQQLGPQGTQQIAQQIGADPNTTQTAIQAALPMLLGGMAGAARQPGGASAIQGFLGQGGGGLGGMLGGLLGGGGGGGLGGMLGGLLGGGQAGGMGGAGMGGMAGAPMGGGGMGGGMGNVLGSVLGGHEPAVQSGVQQASGLNGDQTKRLLMILAPIALAAIAHQRSQRQQQNATNATMAGAGAGGAQDLDGDGIPDYLEQEARQAQARSTPHVGGLVGRILDMAQRPPR
jgi:hypothetical protein